MYKLMLLLSYACTPKSSFKRTYQEQSITPVENCFLLDKSRIINSSAFRRLEYKTQVFVNYIGDHYRTRLTHSLEVAQISSKIARALSINSDLSETIALAHDLGHPPFGHAGESALNEVAIEYGGFDHNIQTLKTVTKLEKEFAEFNGLNLTFETLDALIKHNGPVKKEDQKVLKLMLSDKDFNFQNHGSLECQIASLADDIAYNKHDIDDGLRAKYFSLEEILNIEPFKSITQDVIKKYNKLDNNILNKEVLRHFSEFMISDLISETTNNIKAKNIKSTEDIKNQDDAIATFSEQTKNMLKSLRTFLMQKFYRHYQVNRMNMKAKKIVKDLFNAYIQSPECLPISWQNKLQSGDNNFNAQIVIDYIAGMTDRYAVEEHKKIFNLYSFKI